MELGFFFNCLAYFLHFFMIVYLSRCEAKSNYDILSWNACLHI
jgi:hypothetical protein